MFNHHLDQRIFKTIRGHTSENAQTLMGIIASVDAMERLILSLDELSGGLQRLINTGHIIEIKKHKFVEAFKEGNQKSFSGVSESDYEIAVKQYRNWFDQQLAKLDDETNEEGFVWQKLVIRLVTPEKRSLTYEDEDTAENLADTIEPIILQSGLGEINGFEYGSVHIDILIFGKATDSDVDQIYNLLVPLFRKANCEPGSRIIRFYNERNEEIESDIIF